MINAKMIARIMGALFFIEAGFLILCSFLAVYYNESDISAFLYSAAITAGAGSIAALAGKNAEKRISRRDGYVIVTLAWVFFSLFGMLPFYLSGYIPTITDAFFETMSGFTTTGASILDNIESLPHGLLFWRSMTQWIGGLGIVFFTIAVLPIFGVGSVQLFAAEATGPTHDKVHPRIGVTAKWIWTIYLGLTITEIILLVAGGMNFFDSVCHSLTTTATGGYSTKQNSIAAFNSPYIEYIITLFMFLAGINFTLLYLLFLKGNFKRLFQNTELHWYLGTVGFFTLFTTVTLIFTVSDSLVFIYPFSRNGSLTVYDMRDNIFVKEIPLKWPNFYSEAIDVMEDCLIYYPGTVSNGNERVFISACVVNEKGETLMEQIPYLPAGVDKSEMTLSSDVLPSQRVCGIEHSVQRLHVVQRSAGNILCSK